MSQDQAADRRSLYRLRYPPADCPQAQIEEQRFSVTEISEGGLRLRLSGPSLLPAGLALRGELCFHDGEIVGFAGTVLRAQEQDLVLRLDQGISFRRMVIEQHWLQRRYPQRFTAED